MRSDTLLRDRIRPGRLLALTAIVAAATYFEFVDSEAPSVYTVLLWLLVVPLLLTAAVEGVREHSLYQPVLYGSFVAIGVLQYLDGAWGLLAGLFALVGIVGLVVEIRKRVGPAPA